MSIKNTWCRNVTNEGLEGVSLIFFFFTEAYQRFVEKFSYMYPQKYAHNIEYDLSNHKSSCVANVDWIPIPNYMFQ